MCRTFKPPTLGGYPLLHQAFACFLTVALTGLALIQAAPQQAVSPKPVTVAKALTNAEVGARVERTLREARYLEMIGTVHQVVQKGDEEGVAAGLQPISFHSHMSPESLRSEITKDGKLIAAFSLVDGRVREYRPQEKNRPLFEYDAPYANGAEDTISQTEFDCLFASQIFSWVGVRPGAEIPLVMDKAAMFREQITQGTMESDQYVGDFECWVFRRIIPMTDQTTGEDRSAQNIIFVDKTSFLVVRWDTIFQRIHRIRSCDVARLGQSDMNLEWEIKAQGVKSPLSKPPIGEAR
jgi:hypothetical protein